MAEYIDKEKLMKALQGKQQALSSTYYFGRWFFAIDNAIIKEQPAAEVEEKKDCNLCIHTDRHATQYPCSHCKNCYTDKFKPKTDGRSETEC